LVALKEPLV